MQDSIKRTVLIGGLPEPVAGSDLACELGQPREVEEHDDELPPIAEVAEAIGFDRFRSSGDPAIPAEFDSVGHGKGKGNKGKSQNWNQQNSSYGGQLTAGSKGKSSDWSNNSSGASRRVSALSQVVTSSPTASGRRNIRRAERAAQERTKTRQEQNEEQNARSQNQRQSKRLPCSTATDFDLVGQRAGHWHKKELMSGSGSG